MRSPAGLCTPQSVVGSSGDGRSRETSSRPCRAGSASIVERRNKNMPTTSRGSADLTSSCPVPSCGLRCRRPEGERGMQAGGAVPPMVVFSNNSDRGHGPFRHLRPRWRMSLSWLAPPLSGDLRRRLLLEAAGTAARGRRDGESLGVGRLGAGRGIVGRAARRAGSNSWRWKRAGTQFAGRR